MKQQQQQQHSSLCCNRTRSIEKKKKKKRDPPSVNYGPIVTWQWVGRTTVDSGTDRENFLYQKESIMIKRESLNLNYFHLNIS